MGRAPCCEEIGVKRGPWTAEEDEKLMDYISKHGSRHWRTVPKHAGLNRCGKSCRLRWTNYLRPDIKRGNFTPEEEQLVNKLHSVLGNKWSKIATHLPGRTDNEIKNLWNTQIRKKLLQMGIDPETHKPRTDMKHLINLSQLLAISNSNNNNLMNPSALALQQPHVTQLPQIQLLENLLQLMINGNSFVNNMNNNTLSLLPIHSLINNPLELEAYLNGTNTNTTSTTLLTNNEEPLLKRQEIHGNPTMLPPAAQSENPINNPAALLSSSSGNDIFNQTEIESTSNTDDQMSTRSPNSSSSIFDPWEKLLEDDHTSDSFWKDILDLTSNSTSPFVVED